MSLEQGKDFAKFDLEAGARHLFGRLMDWLPRDTASLSEESTNDPEGGLDLVLVPRRVGAARIAAHVVRHLGVDLWCGEGAVFEVPLGGRRYSTLPCLEEVELLTRAVINGRFSETLWQRKGRVVAAIGKIDLGDRRARSAWARPFAVWLLRGEKHVSAYEPYVEKTLWG
jgi:hypothetical protein